MKAFIEINNGSFAGRRLALRSPVLMSFGRTAQADYAIPYDAQLSGVHFELELDGDMATVRDLGSRNGTMVNGIKIVSQILNNGDLLVAGDTTFSFHCEAPSSNRISSVENSPAASATSPDDTMQGAAIQGAAMQGVGQFDPYRPYAKAPATEPQSDLLRQRSTAEQNTNACNSQLELGKQPTCVISSKLPYAAALEDDSEEVMVAALEAAAWTQESWLLDFCRSQCQSISTKNLLLYEMFAVLGRPIDLEPIATISASPVLGARRMRIAGKYGHPALLPFLLENFLNRELRTAIEAGKAFEKITGCNVDADERVTLPPEDGSEPDEFEAEFLDQEKLPDVKLAQRFLREQGDHFKSSTRWSRGVDVAGPMTREVFMGLDLEARWEAALRGVYRNELHLGPAQLLKLRPLQYASR